MTRLDSLDRLLCLGFPAECQKNEASRWTVSFWANAADRGNTPTLIAYGEATQFIRALELANGNIKIGGEASRFYTVAYDAFTVYPKGDPLHFLDCYIRLAKKARIYMSDGVVRIEIAPWRDSGVKDEASGPTLYEAMVVLVNVLKEKCSRQAVPR